MSTQEERRGGERKERGGREEGGRKERREGGRRVGRTLNIKKNHEIRWASYGRECKHTLPLTAHALITDII